MTTRQTESRMQTARLKELELLVKGTMEKSKCKSKVNLVQQFKTFTFSISPNLLTQHVRVHSSIRLLTSLPTIIFISSPTIIFRSLAVYLNKSPFAFAPFNYVPNCFSPEAIRVSEATQELHQRRSLNQRVELRRLAVQERRS